jgi:UDP-N-acetylmuramoyl-L-alanyl-D-glutamate--2,6-diaminopimelate ligase
MRLKRIISDIVSSVIYGDPDISVNNITFNSKEVTPGSLFIALKGSSSDGHKYIGDAVAAGASTIVCEEGGEITPGICTVIVKDSHKALGLIASAFYDKPSEKIRVVGITGTNGKTTTVTLLYKLFTSLGYKCGLISTIANYVGEVRGESTHTTPDPVKLNSLMNEMVISGCEFCFMEVSSHSLDQQRVAGIKFEGAIFSNITHDHLDYHKTFIEYIRVKKSLFDNLSKESFALINIDDKNGLVMAQNCVAKLFTYSCLSPATFNCRIIEKGLDGMLVRIENSEVWTRFIGTHNAYNLLAVYSAATLLGASKEELLVALSGLESVSGRLEYIKGERELTAVVDYAHTPDALENVLKTLRDCSDEREIVTVFGCGGNRDKSKRPEMAAISAKYSDKIVVTSDNPRFEDPDDIIKDIREGFDRADTSRVLFITDRREAIKAAVAISSVGSIILVAGKGHEDYQEIKGIKYHFDDKEIIAEIINPK